MEPRLQPGRHRGSIVLADISGYTAFLEAVRVAHVSTDSGEVPDAYTMMSGLLDGIATAIDPPLTLVKFEGDAVFAVGADGVAPTGSDMLDCIRSCYTAFAGRVAEAAAVFTCDCGVCQRRGVLDLKFVVHHGEYFVQAVGSHVEVVGPDVIVAHRLLKNSAAEAIGSRGYGLFTDQAGSALGLPLDGEVRITEHIDGGGTIEARVLALSA